MKILVVGGGGREHALVWKLVGDSSRPDVFCAPGNAGTAEIATNLDIKAEDVEGLRAWAVDARPDLTVIGPEAPLCAGLSDVLAAENLLVFGPTAAAAQLEGSKLFAKEIMRAAGVPTAKARSFTSADEALAYLHEQGAPVVVKAEGLAAGKGVTVCETIEQADRAVREAMVDRAFGDAGNRVLIEECLSGEEASILALVDGETIVLLASSQDHKRALNGDQGPNTGGMGAYSPAPVVTEALWPIIREQVFERTLNELKKRNIVFRGVLYAGLMIDESVPKVLEFNCRFGDPETQVVLPRLSCDLSPALAACSRGELVEDMISWRTEPCVCVVMASGGYPGPYEKGKPIAGLKAAGELDDVVVFHAGTKQQNGQAITSGGRVLGVTALGPDLKQAVGRAYAAASQISFDGAHYRTDIAHRAFSR